MQTKKVATLDKGKGKRRFGTFAVFQNPETGRDLPPLSLSKALVRTGVVGAGSRRLINWSRGLGRGLPGQRGEEEVVPSDYPTADRGSFLEAVLPKSGWN